MTIEDLLKPEVLLALDMTVLAALTVAIVVGLRLGSRLKALRQTHGEWNREMATFAERADAAEAGLERLRTALIAEAHYRREQDNAADRAATVAPNMDASPKFGPITPAAIAQIADSQPEPEPEPEPEFLAKPGRAIRTARAEAVLSMQ